MTFHDWEVCWEKPKYARGEGQAIAVFLQGLGRSWTYLNRVFKLEKHKDQKHFMTLPQGQYSSISMMLVCLQMTIGKELPSPPCCRFLLKFRISSFVSMWNENQTKQNNNVYTAGGAEQPSHCHCFSEFLWLTVAIAYPFPRLFFAGGDSTFSFYVWIALMQQALVSCGNMHTMGFYKLNQVAVEAFLSASDPVWDCSSESQAQTPRQSGDTFLCSGAWCSPCSHLCVPRPFTSLLLELRHGLGVF